MKATGLNTRIYEQRETVRPAVGLGTGSFALTHKSDWKGRARYGGGAC